MQTTDSTTSTDFTPEQVTKLTSRLRAWAHAHPEPTKAVMVFSGGREFTPRMVVDAVVAKNEDGLRILGILAQGLVYVSFEDILASYPV